MYWFGRQGLHGTSHHPHANSYAIADSEELESADSLSADTAATVARTPVLS